MFGLEDRPDGVVWRHLRSVRWHLAIREGTRGRHYRWAVVTWDETDQRPPRSYWWVSAPVEVLPEESELVLVSVVGGDVSGTALREVNRREAVAATRLVSAEETRLGLGVPAPADVVPHVQHYCRTGHVRSDEVSEVHPVHGPDSVLSVALAETKGARLWSGGWRRGRGGGRQDPAVRQAWEATGHLTTGSK